MKLFLYNVLLALVIAGVLHAYNQPEIIGVLTSPQEQGARFASDFCWIGDQNGDGYDDLLVNQDYNLIDSLTNVYLFHGSERIENEPVFTYSSYQRGIAVGIDNVYFGSIAENQPPRFGFQSIIHNQAIKVEIYSRSEQPNNDVIHSMGGVNWESAHIINSGFRDRPKDPNGDGSHDMVIVR